MKIYLVQELNDPCAYFVGVFTNKQAAQEVAEIVGKNQKFGCTVSEHDLLETREQWQEAERKAFLNYEDAISF